MLKFKIGDTVKIMSGKDKGREGKIEVILNREQKAIIPGVNIYKKHIKKVLAADGKGGIYEIPRPISFSAISLICPSCKKVTRVSFEKSGKEKNRVCTKCKNLIDKK